MKTHTQKLVENPVEIPSDDGVLLTYQQAGVLLSMGRTKLSKLVADGIVPHIKIGANVRFRRSSLLAWAAKQETGGLEA